MPRTGFLRRYLLAFKSFVCSSDELPHLLSLTPAFSSGNQAWIITGTLVHRTPFGTLSAESTCRISADSEAQALSQGGLQIRGFYPGYSLTRLTAAPAR